MTPCPKDKDDSCDQMMQHKKYSVNERTVNLKARFGWSDKSFNELLALLKNMLPNDNILPKIHYQAKKILCLVGMKYQKIHACPNDCILYKNQFAEMRKCPTCRVSHYKVNKGVLVFSNNTKV